MIASLRIISKSEAVLEFDNRPDFTIWHDGDGLGELILMFYAISLPSRKEDNVVDLFEDTVVVLEAG